MFGKIDGIITRLTIGICFGVPVNNMHKGDLNLRCVNIAYSWCNDNAFQLLQFISSV